MKFNELIEIVRNADMVLVGLGEEFDDISSLRRIEGYSEARAHIEESGNLWLLPAVNNEYRQKNKERSDEIEEALINLIQVLDGKNYFVLSTSLNDGLSKLPWREGRLVTPCGGGIMKQCPDCCSQGISIMTEQDINALSMYIEGIHESDNNLPDLGHCPVCGKKLILNNIYADQYDEKGYLPGWQFYTKWLQGSINRKLVILELGVGMKYPSVIRWPFEKIAFFNQKASFFRVNETLYQLSEELSEKGVSIAKNSIAWLRYM